MKTRILLFIALALLGNTYAQVGIGTTSPNSTLDVRGSFSLNYRAFTSSTTAASTDNTLAFTGSTAATLTLPDATACTGRMYVIKNASTTLPTPVFTIATTSSQTIDAGTNWLLDEQNEMITVVSNGTNWNVVGSNPAKTRSNYVLVKAVTDFPAPVGGVITLNAGWVYEINGLINIAYKIDLNDAIVKGGGIMGNEVDALIYSGTAELFTGSKGGNITNLELEAPVSGSMLFNINALGAQEDLIVMNCFFDQCDNIGILQGFGGEILFNNIDMDNNNNGITFQNDSVVILTNVYWFVNNHNIFEKFIGSFQTIQKLGGISRSFSVNTATALDVSGITSVSSGGSIKSAIFEGDGTYVTGTFAKQWEVESLGLNTEKDDVASGNIYISASATTTFSTANTPTKVLGTTSTAELFRVTSPANNKLVYTGTKTRRFIVNCTLSLISAGNNKVYSVYVAKNGVILPESKQSRKTVIGTDQAPLALSCTVSLSTNDYLEVWVENNTDATSMTVLTMNLAIK